MVYVQTVHKLLAFHGLTKTDYCPLHLPVHVRSKNCPSKSLSTLATVAEKGDSRRFRWQCGQGLRDIGSCPQCIIITASSWVDLAVSTVMIDSSGCSYRASERADPRCRSSAVGCPSTGPDPIICPLGGPLCSPVRADLAMTKLIYLDRTAINRASADRTMTICKLEGWPQSVLIFTSQGVQTDERTVGQRCLDWSKSERRLRRALMF